jgi:hypothetical protein
MQHLYNCIGERKETVCNTCMHGSVVWDSCNINCHQRLLKLQKRAARIILDVDKRTPSIELFNKLNWLPLSKQSLIKRTSITFKRVNTDYFTLNI